MTLSKFARHLLPGLLAVAMLGYWGYSLLAGNGYSLLSSQASPNGKLSVAVFRSLRDGFGHAPYGQLLVISPRTKLDSPDDGYVFFAGYCKAPVTVEWRSDDALAVRCVGGQPRTLASLAYGIKVSYEWQ